MLNCRFGELIASYYLHLEYNPVFSYELASRILEITQKLQDIESYTNLVKLVFAAPKSVKLSDQVMVARRAIDMSPHSVHELGLKIALKTDDFISTYMTVKISSNKFIKHICTNTADETRGDVI